MGDRNLRILSVKRPILASMCLILILVVVFTQPASSEASILKVSSRDMAPGIIYTGEPHTQTLNDIVMLQITFNTTNDEGITIKALTIHRTGQSSDLYATSIHIYEDVNNNGTFDSQNDTEISTSIFELGKAEFSLTKTVTPIDPLIIFVTIDISSEAILNGTLGMDIPDTDYIECNEMAIIEFERPISSKNSTILLDTDGDFNPDITDLDDDNDGYMDELELAAGSDTKDVNSHPEDTDSDFVPDSIDTDDDNDGVPDKYDDFPKDKNLQRDYTVVIIYLIIVITLIFIMIFILRKGGNIIPKSELYSEDDDEFKIDKKSKVDLDEEILDDDDLLNDL
jgi:hypothetical protein